MSTPKPGARMREADTQDKHLGKGQMGKEAEEVGQVAAKLTSNEG